MRLIRVMCTGRLDLSLILRALSKGADGVFIAGCHLNECNYITHGNFHALSMAYIARKMLERVGLNPNRVRMELISGSEGTRFVELMNEYCGQMREMGPLGVTEGLEEAELKARLHALSTLVPYIRLVERERLRVPLKTEEDFARYFAGDEFKRLFDELIGDKLAMSQIVQLLKDKPMTTGEISTTLHLTPSEVAKHMNNSSRQGLVRYDEKIKSYSLA